MPVMHEGKHTAEFLVSEANGSRSRDVITLAEGHVIKPGEVLAKLESSGEYVPLSTAAEPPAGADVARAVSYDHADSTDGVTAAVVVARDAEVRASDLVWPEGIGSEALGAGLAALAGHHIIAR